MQGCSFFPIKIGFVGGDGLELEKYVGELVLLVARSWLNVEDGVRR